MPRVLVVDDDPMVCIAIEICLQRQGFDVTIADGGEAGMRQLSSASFDVMLVDIFMPHMRGFESVRMFHERAPEIPLIAMHRRETLVHSHVLFAQFGESA